MLRTKSFQLNCRRIGLFSGELQVNELRVISEPSGWLPVACISPLITCRLFPHPCARIFFPVREKIRRGNTLCGEQCRLSYKITLIGHQNFKLVSLQDKRQCFRKVCFWYFVVICFQSCIFAG